MYFERILDIYQQKVCLKRKISDMEKKEKRSIAIIASMSLVIGVMLLISFFQPITKLHIATTVLCLVLISYLMYLEICFRKYDNNKLLTYDKKLERLKNILLDHEYKYYSVKCINEIIDWCDRYSQEDDIWIGSLRPLGVFFTVVLIPLSLVVLDCFFGKFNDIQYSDILLFAVAYVLAAFAIFLLCHMFGNEVKEILNSKRIMAKRLANDLRNLKLKEFKTLLKD